METATESFNPCFIGLASATLIAIYNHFFVYVFQSLFYWISLCDLPISKYWIRERVSFNPCFIGLASATVEKRSSYPNLRRFNPCFIGLASATIFATG